MGKQKDNSLPHQRKGGPLRGSVQKIKKGHSSSMAIPLYGLMLKASGLSYLKPSHTWLLVAYIFLMQQATNKSKQVRARPKRA